MSVCERCGQRLQQRNLRLAHALVDADLSVAELARRTELSRVTIGGVVSGRLAATTKVKGRISSVLGLPVDQLFDVEEVSA